MVHMKNSEFQNQISNAARPVVVDLWAPWCGPCRAMEPAVMQMGQKYAGEVDVLKINADESPEVVQALGVMGIPTMIGFASGNEILRCSGLQSAEALDIFFDAVLHQRKPAIIPPAPADRLIRSGAGVGLIAMGWLVGPSILLMLAGAVLLFSAFYDRCPIYRAIVPRLAAFFQR
jgi:thioredoxin